MNPTSSFLDTLSQLAARLAADEEWCGSVERAAAVVLEALLRGNTIYVAGNGGSAAEAQHFAAELVGRYKRERKGYPAVALTTDTSILTAVGNDYGYDQVFVRQLQALGREGDVFLALSTSGNSENLIKALEFASKNDIATISLSGKEGGRSAGMADIDLIVPFDETPRIQEIHLLVVHAICEIVDDQL